MPTLSLPQAFALALEHHQAGRLAEAEALYRQMLTVAPNQPEALHHLGLIAHEVGRHEVAVELIRRAVALAPDDSSAHSNLGEACRAGGYLDEAISSFRRALELDPHFAPTYYGLGNTYRDRGRLDEAVVAFRRSIELKADFTEAHFKLGLTLGQCDNLEQALASFCRVLALHPSHAEAYYNLGVIMVRLGRVDEALGAYRRAIQCKPDYAEAYCNLGNALSRRGQYGEAIAAYRRALEAKPDYVPVYTNLGAALAAEGRLAEATAAHRRALELQPDAGAAHNNLGNALKDMGVMDEALAAYRRAAQLQPDRADTLSNLIYALLFDPDQAEDAMAGEQRLWNARFGQPTQHPAIAHPNERDPNRRLRIGYVSPDFRQHVVGMYLAPLLQGHDHREFEIFCYSGAAMHDRFTATFQQCADHWRDTVGVSDEALVEIIRNDRVDILVDLTQHMAGNRLPVFARRPAPVQVSFAGYPAGTGLEAIPYRISDRYLESKIGDRRSDIGGELCSPEQVLLIDSYWCYYPWGIETAVNGLPAQVNGSITFGCLNNFCKVNEPVLQLWARIMVEIPDSRLVLVTVPGDHRQRTCEILERAGVSAQRVEFVEPGGLEAYFGFYHRLDIALDPFPYNGGATTLDALWMGVPVISLAGSGGVSRAVFGQMSLLGLLELVAFSGEDYIRIATQLARDLPRLAEMRAALRSRMKASPLMDAPRFARNIESAYRIMWRRWCDSAAVSREAGLKA